MVTLWVGTELLGVGFRLSFNAKTYLVTAAHVLNEAKQYDLHIRVGNRTFPVDREWKLKLFSSQESLDFAFLEVPDGVWAVLGVKALVLGNLSLAKVRGVSLYGFSATRDPQVSYGTASATPSRLFRIHHDCWSAKGYSGSPLIADGKVIGIHTGAKPTGPALNEATSFAVLKDYMRSKESEQKSETWSENQDDEFDRRYNEFDEDIVLDAHGPKVVNNEYKSRGYSYSRRPIQVTEAEEARLWDETGGRWGDYMVAIDELDESDLGPEPKWESSNVSTSANQTKEPQSAANNTSVVSEEPAKALATAPRKPLPPIPLKPAALFQTNVALQEDRGRESRTGTIVMRMDSESEKKKNPSCMRCTDKREILATFGTQPCPWCVKPPSAPARRDNEQTRGIEVNLPFSENGVNSGVEVQSAKASKPSTISAITPGNLAKSTVPQTAAKSDSAVEQLLHSQGLTVVTSRRTRRLLKRLSPTSADGTGLNAAPEPKKPVSSFK